MVTTPPQLPDDNTFTKLGLSPFGVKLVLAGLAVCVATYFGMDITGWVQGWIATASHFMGGH